MIDELRQAVEKAEKLSAQEQKAIARMILDEISWDNAFINSQDKLATLAEEALAEFKLGKTKPMDLGK